MDLFLAFFLWVFGGVFSLFFIPDPDETPSRKRKVLAIIFGVFSLFMLIILGIGLYFYYLDPGTLQNDFKNMATGKVLMLIGGVYVGLIILIRVISSIITHKNKKSDLN